MFQIPTKQVRLKYSMISVLLLVLLSSSVIRAEDHHDVTSTVQAKIRQKREQHCQPDFCKLLIDIGELKTAAENQVVNNSVLERRLSSAEIQVTALKTDNENLATRLSLAENQYRNLEKQVTTLLNVNSVLESRLKTTETEFNVLKSRLKTTETEVDVLKTTETEVENPGSDVQEWKRCVGDVSTIGAKVRVKPSVTTPKYTWGPGVSHSSVGVVKSVRGKVLEIHFPGGSDWSGEPSEMEVVCPV